MTILIRGGRVLDPAAGIDGVRDVLLADGVVKAVDTSLDVPADRVVDAGGFFVMPGLIDMHVHLREPGYEHKETIRTGALAAAHGGFTTICPMPNTKPVTDSPERIEWVLRKAAEVSPVHILPIGAVTEGQAGEKLTDIKGMAQAGAVGISEDGKSVMNAALYAEGMKQAAQAGNLVGKGCLNAGAKSEELGVLGITNAVEDVIVARDILLAKQTGAKLHLCHCSTKDSVAMIRAAKEDGVAVTAEVCPHHFAMTEDAITANDGNYKMNPPLRTAADAEALREGLKDGVIDVISTDHAPHAKEEKERPISEAPFGIVGLETAVALTITTLVEGGYLTPYQMAERMSYRPAQILGINRGSLKPGSPADVTLIDPKQEYVIDPSEFYSMGTNTPFAGKKVRGRVKMTIVDGNIVYEE